ncbi:hypothetical protein BKA63DRAFT_535404 [Paraphoma chrysanthemicola]|nr:hypothetical protein BKA63DRAFT_535404 [Paraphoma chrysanthemicola]
MVWILLGLSSAPLHLLFNSVVFANLQANNYAVIPTTEDWLEGGAYDTSSFLDYDDKARKSFATKLDDYRIDLTEQLVLRNGTTSLRYRNISTTTCFNLYNNMYISDVGNVYLVQDLPTVWRNTAKWTLVRNETSGSFTWSSNASYTYRTADLRNETTDSRFPFYSSPTQGSSIPNPWMCSSHSLSYCGSDVPQSKSEWKPYDSTVSHCVIEQVETTHCKLQFSLPIAVTVILSNLVKAVCMAITLFVFKDHAALVTVGDAVASYLERPDDETTNRCLYSRHEVEADWNRKDSNGDRAPRVQPKTMKYKPKRRLWAMGASQERWIWTYATYFAGFCFAIPSMFYSLRGMPRSVSGLWKVGFGTVNSNNLMNFSVSVFGGVLLANTPQALLSYLYLAYNALYTNLFVAREFSSYMHERKALRVTQPQGKQRDTYWLNVPFRYAVPMTLVSGVFHWLASQSLFMVQITITNEARQPARQISTCGYSPMAIILTIVVATIIAGSGVVMARFRYKGGMPLASSCSAAISAACHPPEGDVDAHLLPVQWGAVKHGSGEGDEEGVGHCSFSSWPVEVPIAGRVFA